MEFPWRCNVDTIAMDLKVSWEMSAKIKLMERTLNGSPPPPIASAIPTQRAQSQT